MRKLMWFTTGFGSACIVGAYFVWSQIWVAALPFAGISLCCAFLKGRWERFAIAAALTLGIAAGCCWIHAYDVCYLRPIRALDGATVSVDVTVSDYSYASQYGSIVEGKLERQGKSYSVQLYLQEEKQLDPGDRIEGSFSFCFTPGGAQNAAYHKGNGVFLLGYQKSEITVTKADTVPSKYVPAKIRHQVTQILDTVFPADTAFFAKALLLGDRSDVDYETNTDFKVSGISHIIAVSGLHVSILFSLVYLFFGYRRILTPLIGIPAVLLFAAVVGFTPSITRACMMQILVMLGLMFDSEYDRATALAFSALVMLVVNPLVITSASFQMSVGCMAGIFLFADKISRRLQNIPAWRSWKGKSLRVRLRQWLCGGVSVTLSAMVFTTPMAAYYFGSVSLVGVITNLLTLWVIHYIFYGIMAVCLMSLFWLQGAKLLAALLSWLIRYVIEVAGLLASFPMAAVYTTSIYIVIWLVGCYVLFLIFLCMPKKKPLIFATCCAVGLCLSLGCSWIEPLLDGSRMTVLDVGQGQCILLQAEGKTYLIDCGGDSDTAAADLAAETLLSMGIFRLDGIVVTHYDRDHGGGVGYLLTRIPTDAVLLPDTTDEEGIQAMILSAAGQSCYLVTEDVSITWGQTCMTVFAPVTAGSSNESGLSILFHRENCDILITGDMSTLGESLLLEDKQLPRVTALVAGHHGSASSTGDELLSALRPQYVFISVGKGNRYNHPDPAVLERLREYGCAVYRTDDNGTIVFRR